MHIGDDIASTEERSMAVRFQLVIDCADPEPLARFWAAALGYELEPPPEMLVRRQFDEIWNGGNWATARELYAPDYVNHDPYNPDQGTGPEGFIQRVSGYRGVLHGFDLRIERQIAEGDMVETHWSLRGTHGGELEGTAPTGKSVYVDGQLLSRIVDGKFVEEWVHWDTLGLLRQIGTVPPPKP
jgi:predicted ester cyclase